MSSGQPDSGGFIPGKPYKDKNGNISQIGVRRDMHMNLVGDPYNFLTEGRITASSHGLLHRLEPIDPTTVGKASITSWMLPP